MTIDNDAEKQAAREFVRRLVQHAIVCVIPRLNAQREDEAWFQLWMHDRNHQRRHDAVTTIPRGNTAAQRNVMEGEVRLLFQRRRQFNVPMPPQMPVTNILDLNIFSRFRGFQGHVFIQQDNAGGHHGGNGGVDND